MHRDRETQKHSSDDFVSHNWHVVEMEAHQPQSSRVLERHNGFPETLQVVNRGN